MQAYPTSPDESSYDWQATMAHYADYIADQQRFPVAPLQPCKNSECRNSSYALFCSEACRLVIEQPDDTYYSDGEGVLLGYRQLCDDQAAADGDLVRKALGMPQAAPVAPPVQALPEAAASATVRLTIAGHSDVLFTVRDMDETRLLDRLETLLQRFQPPAALPPMVQAHGEGFCQTHQVQMKLNPAKPGQGKDWYSHKHQGQWCRGKAA